MQNQLKLKLQIQQETSYQYKHEYPYINVLPKEPTEVYKQKPEYQLEAIKKTQKIPFPQIRELILMYILQNRSTIDVTQCQFLKQKLRNNNFKEYNDKANKILDNLTKEKERLIKLKSVSQKYLQLREEFLGIEFKRSMIRFDHSSLNKELNKFQHEKQIQFTEILKKKHSVSDNQRKAIQHKINQKIINLFNKQTPQLQKQSLQFLQKFQSQKKLFLYSEQFEKSLIFIMSTKQIENKVHPSNDGRLLKEVLNRSLSQVIGKLQNLIEIQLQILYQWRLNCKYDKSVRLNIVDLQNKKDKIQQQIRSEIYGYIPDLLCVLNKDKDNIGMKEKQLKEEYGKFIPGFYDAIEVNLFFKKQSKLNQIIQNQKQLLAEHLRINFGMMVQYSKSSNYISSIDFNKNSVGLLSKSRSSLKKGYLQQIVSKKISFLEEAINFINKQYNELYKEACAKNSGVINKIQTKIEKYKQTKEDSRISTHLIESCARLLGIVNRQ